MLVLIESKRILDSLTVELISTGFSRIDPKAVMSTIARYIPISTHNKFLDVYRACVGTSNATTENNQAGVPIASNNQLPEILADVARKIEKEMYSCKIIQNNGTFNQWHGDTMAFFIPDDNLVTTSYDISRTSSYKKIGNDSFMDFS